MFTITIDPVIWQFGHFALRWYGLIVLIAIQVGIWLVAREVERKGFKKEDFYSAAMWIIVAGLLGARLFHVLDHWHEYSINPIRALYIWEGGLAIWGALIGGLIAAAFLCWKNNWHLAKFLDAAAPGLVLAQAIGRIGCVITGDAMGTSTNGPFGFAYTNAGALVPKLGVYYTPMPVYEIIVNLVIFTILWQMRKRSWADGRLFLVYLVLYSIERFFLAFTSSYRIIAFGLTQSQIIALFGFAISAILLTFLSHRLDQPIVHVE